MKKQFYRVKQLADQRVGRAEKTEILSEDLQNVEKTVDKIKHACQAASKRITASMQGTGSDFEKRLAMLFQKSKGSRDDIASLYGSQAYSDIMKKLNQAGLANSMLESSIQLGETSLLGSVLCGAGEAELDMAKHLCEYEMSVEQNVLVPMTSLLENEVPNLTQTKKKLSKAALDMDTCRSRWMASVKAAHGSSKDMQSAALKADSLKDDYDDGIIKFESCQDSFTTEALEFVSREGEYAEWIIKFMEAQLEYHKTATEILQNILPSMKTKVDESSLRPVFGCPLEEHLKAQNRTIAFVLEECLMYLHDAAIDEQGLFRLAGSSGRIRKLKAAFDAGLVDLAEYAIDVHAVTGVVKLYLRELPDPLLTFELFDEWLKAVSIQDNGAKLQAYWLLIEKLPKENKDNLRYLICFLAKVSEYSDVNKMTPSNIAIVIAPNIVYSETNSADGIHLQHTGLQSSIVESLIVHHKYFFPEGVDFFRSLPLSSHGSKVNSSSTSNSKHQRKQSEQEFQSVTGGLLEEVVGMINSSETADLDSTKSNRGNSSNQGQQTNNNSSVQATSVHVMSHSGSTGTEKKRQAPSPSPAQVKYIGSVSPPTSPQYSLTKPTAQPPPPPSKATAAPRLAPKPESKK